MSTATQDIEALVRREYQHGFVTDIETDTLPRGLNEDVIRMISAKKNEPEFMLEWRLKSYRHWLTMTPPAWAHVHYPPIDYQAISYYSAPRISGAQESGRGGPEAARDLREAGHPAEGAGDAGRCGGGCGVRQRIGGNYL